MNQKLLNLRALFASHNIDGYIIPHSDEYQNEYTPDSAKRLRYITGFTGSSGIAGITKDNQYFWTDGRYKIQARKEVPDYVICDRDFADVAKNETTSSSSLQSKSRRSHATRVIPLMLLQDPRDVLARPRMTTNSRKFILFEYTKHFPLASLSIPVYFTHQTTT